MRIKLYGQPGEMPNAVRALGLGFEVASVGRPIKTRNAGRPGEVSVNIRAALRSEAAS
jgi:hypothetical protein